MPRNRPRLTAHVASDYTTGGSRTFVFTPVDSGFRSHAALVLDENGSVTCHRSTVHLAPHATALARWARAYQRRSIPARF